MQSDELAPGLIWGNLVENDPEQAAIQLEEMDNELARLRAAYQTLTEERDEAREALSFPLAQLRHAYTHLHAERVSHQREFATRLLGPAIERIERAYHALTSAEKQASDTPSAERCEATPASSDVTGGAHD